MIDTLKLSKRLQEASMPREQADALAGSLAEGVQENFVTKETLQAELAKLKAELVFWVVGTVGLGTLVQIGLHFWH
jgi:hypothetical protein